ncbi:hypothetical protein DRJ25_03735 [Candidatus Woesearchaeota archaeon]|nr:MAG: hypothetical protein DRJ25_03735 [Candidatus Woesearchaeota archaeon]
MAKNLFQQAFEDNYYLTNEFAEFCARISNIPLDSKKLSKQSFFLLKNKNISISYYSPAQKRAMQENGISYVSVLPEENIENPSLMEYSILHWLPYENAYKRMDRTFQKNVRRAARSPHRLIIKKQLSSARLDELYNIYCKQMHRLNSFQFPKSYFEEMLRLKSSFVFMIELKNKIIAYSFCFQHKHNLYLSIGGVASFKEYAQYRHYNERIKYACAHKLTIHQGIGMVGTGYDFFKKRVGGISYKTEQFPNQERLMRRLENFLKMPGAGILLRGISRFWPEKFIFNIMPFT